MINQSEDNLEVSSKLLNPFFVGLVLVKFSLCVNPCYFLLSDQLAPILIVSVLLIGQVEKVAECEVAESHEIADGLHDIPT